MKLNLNFSLYKGTTKLKDWWKAVKSHFEAVQIAHNALEDEVAAEKTRLGTEITQRTNADLAMSSRIGAEETARSSADTELNQKITAEAAARTEEDTAINQRLDNLALNGNRNRFLNLEEYTEDFYADIVTDGEGRKYLRYSEYTTDVYNNTYLFRPSKFSKIPEYPSNMIFEVGVAYKHMKDQTADCTEGDIYFPESYIKITYDDNQKENIYFHNSDRAKCKITQSERNFGKYYSVRLLFYSVKKIKKIELIFCCEHNADVVTDECQDYFYIDKLGLYDDNSFSTVYEISEIRNAITSAGNLVKLSKAIQNTQTPYIDEDNGEMTIYVDMPSYTVYLKDEVISIPEAELEITITAGYGTKYVYYRLEKDADGWAGALHISKSDNESGITLNGTRVQWLIGNATFYNEPGPDGTPCYVSNFEITCKDTVITFGGTNENNILCLNLNTANKISLTGAINEVNAAAQSAVSAAAELNNDVDNLRLLLGTLSSELDAVNGSEG